MVQESNLSDKHIETRRSIFVSHLGGLGDLVLLSSAFAALRSAFPDARTTFACRSANAAVFELYPRAPDVILPLELDPYAHGAPAPELITSVKGFISRLQPDGAALFVDAALRPPWLTWVLAAKLQAARTVITSGEAVPLLARQVLESLGLQEARFEHVEVPAGTHELERYDALLSHVGAQRATAFDLNVPKAADKSASAFLASAGLAANEFIACFPVSSAATPEKQWPLELHFDVLRKMFTEFKLSILLLGDKLEAEELEAFADKLRQAGIPSSIYTGEAKDVPAVAALLSKARAYFGNDAGLSHLASAFAVPGVAVHGGGAWPMYGPWGRGSIGIVNPLSCFGCYWDCTFGRGVCVESVPADDVYAALSGLLKGGELPQPKIIELDTVSAGEQAVIADATRRYRLLQADRAARLEALDRSKHELADARREQAELQAAADERLEALRETKEALSRAALENHRIAELDQSIESARKELAERERIIGELEAALEGRDAHTKRLQDSTTQLTAAIEEGEARINALQTVAGAAEAREKVIGELSAALEETDGRAKTLQEAADLRGQKVEELTQALERQTDRIQTLEENAKNFAEMHATAQEREKIIFELNAALNEREKNANKILEIAAERETLIVSLTAAVEERERRLAQLERVAEERLVALKETDEGLRAVTAEADRRAIMLAEVTSLLRERTDES